MQRTRVLFYEKKKKNLKIVQRYCIYFFQLEYMRQNNCFGSNMYNELKRETIVIILTNQHFNYLKKQKKKVKIQLSLQDAK